MLNNGTRFFMVLGLAVMIQGCAGKEALSEEKGKSTVKLRFISWNVEYGFRASAEEIGEFLKQWEPDVVCFNEVPGGDWTARAGKILGMEHVHLGEISSANHKDKYKSILSRTPLAGKKEFILTGNGWNPASVVRAFIEIDGLRIAVYSLHICSGSDIPENSHSADIATRILPQDNTPHIVVMGDFNNYIDGPVMGVYRTAGFSNTWERLGIDTKKKFTCFFKEKEVITYTGSDTSAGKNYGVIDHILFNLAEDTRVIAGGIIKTEKPLSDHKPIWADIQFSGNTI